MHSVTHSGPACQQEACKEFPFVPSISRPLVSFFDPGSVPPIHETLTFPGFSSMALPALAAGLRRVRRDAPASFSNSSIFRPNQKITLTGLLCDNQKDVVWADVYRMDTVFKRKKTGVGLEEPKSGRSLRGKIDQFSKKSRLRLKHQVRNAPQEIQSQFLLTYPADYPLTGKTVKNHLDRWFRAIRKAYGSRNLAYEWCLEFQDRGAPHFHVFFTWPPSNELRRFLAKKWNGIVKGGTAHKWVHLRHKNFTPWKMGKGNYVMKYMQKMEQKDVPACFSDVGRFWGCSRNMKPIAKVIEFDRLALVAGQGWTRYQIENYFQRTMRRYHNSQLRAFGKTSFLCNENWSRVSVPNGSAVMKKLISWVFGACPGKWEKKTGSPPSGDMKYRVPQGGSVPF